LNEFLKSLTFEKSVFWTFKQPLRIINHQYTFWEIIENIELKIMEANTKSLQELENLFIVVSSAFGGKEVKSKKGSEETIPKLSGLKIINKI
jgi:hypothetical protein